MKIILSAIIFLMTVIGRAQEVNLSLYPNVHLIGNKNQTLYIHPKDTREWFLKNPSPAFIGQINACKINNINIAVSAPHVVNTPGWSHPAPKEKSIGEWKNSIDGLELSLAKLSDPQSFGFPKELPEAIMPQNNSPANIFGTLFELSTNSVITINIPGNLEIIEQKESLVQIAEFFKRTNPKGAITSRLNERAKEKPILAMVVDPKFASLVQGLSGAFVWQNKKPVAVFVAAAIIDESTIILLSEPLLETAQKTIAEIKK